MSNTAITADQAAELFRQATTPTAKWAFLDSVAAMCAAEPDKSQREVVEMIGGTPLFISLHGDFRDAKSGGKAASKLKSIRDELSVVKSWAPADRVPDVSFEAHKIVNRLSAQEGRKILLELAKELGGPANVTKAAVKKRLAEVDPDHTPKANGKAAAATDAAKAVAEPPKPETLLDIARKLGKRLTASQLSADPELFAAVGAIAAVYNGIVEREAKKQAALAAKEAKAAAAADKKAAPKAAAAPKAKVAAPKPKVAAPKAKVAAPKAKVAAPKVVAPKAKVTVNPSPEAIAAAEATAAATAAAETGNLF